MNHNNQQSINTEFDIQLYIDKYLIPILEHKWLLLSCILFFSALSVSFSSFVKPEFSSIATIQIGQLGLLETDNTNIGKVIDDTAIFAAAIENMRSSTFRTKIVGTFNDSLKKELDVPLNIPGQIKVKLYPLITKYLKIIVNAVRGEDTNKSIDERLKIENKKKQVQIARLFHRMEIDSNSKEGTIRITGTAFDPTNASLLVVKYIELWEKENLSKIQHTIQERLDIASSQQKRHKGYLDKALKDDSIYRESIGIRVGTPVVPDPAMQIKLDMFGHEISRAKENYNNVNIVVQRLERRSKSVRNNIIVINPAQVPLYPSKDKRMVIILIGIILGIVSGTLPVLAWEYYRGYIRHEKDIQDAVGIPVIGRMPTIH